MRALHNQYVFAVSYHPDIYKFITHGFCSFFCDGLMFCYNVTFFELPLLTSVFWIGLGGSLERPSHSIDLAEMRRYCIMYYQQSYVLILSHEMALIPFTYLNFNLCFNDSLIIYPAFGLKFQGPVLFVFRLWALTDTPRSFLFSLTFIKWDYRTQNLHQSHNLIANINVQQTPFLFLLRITYWEYFWGHDLAKPNVFF